MVVDPTGLPNVELLGAVAGHVHFRLGYVSEEPKGVVGFEG